MKLKDLKAHPKNPRKITDKRLEMLKKSLGEFGDLSGIVFNRKTGRVVGGHQRLKVLPPDAEITMLDNSHGFVMIDGDRFQYREVEWDEFKEKAALLAANQHGGEWDYQDLTDILYDLDVQTIDIELTGFTHEDCVDLFSASGKPQIKDAKDCSKPKMVKCPNCGEAFEAKQNPALAQ